MVKRMTHLQLAKDFGHDLGMRVEDHWYEACASYIRGSEEFSEATVEQRGTLADACLREARRETLRRWKKK